MATFDIKDPEHFFWLIQNNYDQYKSETQKDTAKLLFIIMGLNHLREWIAPDFPRNKNFSDIQNNSEQFYCDIFQLEEFRNINNACNNFKHLSSDASSSVFGNFDDISDFDTLSNVDNGPVLQHLYDNRPVEALIDPVLNKYRKWFEGST